MVITYSTLYLPYGIGHNLLQPSAISYMFYLFYSTMDLFDMYVLYLIHRMMTIGGPHHFCCCRRLDNVYRDVSSMLTHRGEAIWINAKKRSSIFFLLELLLRGCKSLPFKDTLRFNCLLFAIIK